MNKPLSTSHMDGRRRSNRRWISLAWMKWKHLNMSSCSVVTRNKHAEILLPSLQKKVFLTANLAMSKFLLVSPRGQLALPRARHTPGAVQYLAPRHQRRITKFKFPHVSVPNRPRPDSVSARSTLAASCPHLQRRPLRSTEMLLRYPCLQTTSH